MPIKDFRDLEVWNRSVDLAVEVYRITRRFPPEERYELTTQLRKAAVSISSNIAEGSGRATTRDLLNFLAIARGSLRETESLLVVSQRLGFAPSRDVDHLVKILHSIGQMLTALRSSLQSRLKR